MKGRKIEGQEKRINEIKKERKDDQKQRKKEINL